MRNTTTIAICAATLLTLAVVMSALPAVSLGASAHAYVSKPRHEVRYRAAPGRANRLLVEVWADSRQVRFTDEGARIVPGAGCESVTVHAVDCRIVTVVRFVRVALGDADDKATAVTGNPQVAEVDLAGARGEDYLRGDGPSRFSLFGGEGSDRLVGGRGPDVLRGWLGDDLLAGRDGDDLLIGGEGQDVLKGGPGVDLLIGGEGRDQLDARDQPPGADAVVSCGPGRDLATEDRIDQPKTVGCEAIHG